MTRDLALRDNVPGDAAARKSHSERETVLVIHGTFANKLEAAPNWWQRDGDFCKNLDDSLLKRGSPARCWAHVNGEENVFAWTGDNLERERRIGGEGLAKQIEDLEARRDIDRYHIIAHSHGGNVVLHALRALPNDPKKLGAVIFLGTPVLHFSRLPLWLDRIVPMAYYVLVLVVSVILALELQSGEGRVWSFLMASVAVLFLIHGWWTRPEQRQSIYGKGRAHAFEFEHDEAILVLKKAMEFAKQPGETLKQIMKKKPTIYARPPKRLTIWETIWLNFKKNSAYQFLIDLLNGLWNPKIIHIQDKMNRSDLGRAIVNNFGLLSGMIFVLIFVLGLWPVSAGMNVNGMELGPIILFKLFSVIVLLCFTILIIMAFLEILSALFKFLVLAYEWMLDLFLRGPGARIMGKVVRNAAFGGQCEEVSRPQELLPETERARSEIISKELQKKMNELSDKTAARAGQALYAAFSDGEVRQFKEHILARLTDSELAHCKYYCEDEIIKCIAELIAPRRAAS